MRAHRARSSLVLLAALLLVGPPTASAQKLIELGTLPGNTPSQASVGTAIDIICPKLAARSNSLNSAQSDLLARCGDMKLGGFATSQLPDILGKVSPEDATVQGTSAVQTRSAQLRAVGARLASLRLGATGISFNGVAPDLDGKTASTGQLLGSGGGGAGDSSLLSRLGLFVNGVGSFGNVDSTPREAGFDYHNVGMTAGADYRFTDTLIAGAAFSYLNSEADIVSHLGEVTSNGYGLSLYGTYYVGAFYVDLLSGFTYRSYDTTRNIVYGPTPGFTGTAVDRTATGDTSGWQYTFNGGIGYDFHVAGSTLTPYFRVEYLHLDINGYTESGANGLDLKVQSQTAESLLTILGGRVAHAFSTSFGVLVPQIHGEWRHESLNDARSIKAQFANDPFNQVFTVPTDNPDRDFFAVGAGITSQFRKGMAAFLDFEAVVGLANVTSYNFTAGMRIEF